MAARDIVQFAIGLCESVSICIEVGMADILLDANAGGVQHLNENGTVGGQAVANGCRD